MKWHWRIQGRGLGGYDRDEERHKYNNEIPTGSNQAFFSRREKRAFKIHAKDIRISPSLLWGRPFNFWGGGEGGEWVGDCWSAIFFSTNLLGRIFFPLLICLQDFFPLEMVSPSFCKNVFTFTLCYCSNGPDIELQSLKKFSKLYKIIILYSYVFGKSFFTLMFYEITIFSYYKVMQIKQVWKLK